MGVVHQEEIRKGPWTEQEDFQLVCFVGLFGDRRWDFIAKVSGLNRTGKSCRLRWVNYLHPGLKRGKMTPQEERLVLELHAKWGNRWSRIARKLPGRTDNEIKNYWRTHMRKKAQEKKRANNNNNNNSSSSSPSPPSPSLSSSSNSIKSSSSSSNITTVESLPFPDSTTGVESFYDTGGRVDSAPIKEKKKADHDQEEKEQEAEEEKGYYSMDEIWKEISLPEVNNIMNNIDQVPFGNDNNIINNDNNSINFSIPDPLITSSSSSAWDDHHHEYYSDSLWKMVDEEASKAFFPTTANDQFFSCFGYELGCL